MGLRKQIELDNGVTTNYHRIVSIKKITNVSNIIEVASYTTQDKRQEEIEYYQNANTQAHTLEEYNNNQVTKKSINVFINTEIVHKDYNETETIENAYSYLKTLDKYKDAEDV